MWELRLKEWTLQRCLTCSAVALHASHPDGRSFTPRAWWLTCNLFAVGACEPANQVLEQTSVDSDWLAEVRVLISNEGHVGLPAARWSQLCLLIGPITCFPYKASVFAYCYCYSANTACRLIPCVAFELAPAKHFLTVKFVENSTFWKLESRSHYSQCVEEGLRRTRSKILGRESQALRRTWSIYCLNGIHKGVDSCFNGTARCKTRTRTGLSSELQ